MNYNVFGSWELPRKNRIIDSSNEARKIFWGEVDNDTKGLPYACGCWTKPLSRRTKAFKIPCQG